jgi:hypothetical protein
MALYVITPKDGESKKRLVDAPTRSAALRHVAADAFNIDVASPMECVALGKDGVEVEKVAAE